MNTPAFRQSFGRLLQLLVVPLCVTVVASAIPNQTSGSPDAINGLPAYHARFERPRPVVAIVGENAGTELSDFVIPYGVLNRSGVAEVITVSTQPGVLRMRPVLKVQADTSITTFDLRYPQGAGYVIVPAVVKFRDPALLAWLKAQAGKGATLMSICDGAAVVAGTGLMDGHRATAHWASLRNRRRWFPEVNWIEDVRYVADGRIISTAGISAALPATFALVEAIAGRERAQSLARELGSPDWSRTHHTAPFHLRFGVNLRALVAVTYTNGWFHGTDKIGLRIADGVDEIALAASPEPVRSRSGLMILPDTLAGGQRMDLQLPDLVNSPSAQAFDTVLESIERLYGHNTAYGTALIFEYPMMPQRHFVQAAGGR